MKKNVDGLTNEVRHIKAKFLKPGYPLLSVDSIAGDFQSSMNVEDSFFILLSLFDEDEPFTLIEITFYEKNKNKSIIIDYVLVREIVLVNQNIIWQLDGESITVLPWAFKTFKQNHASCKGNVSKYF